jgi:hypothetical protein
MTRAYRHDHSMTRLDVFTGVGFDDFLTAFEAAAPPYDPVPVQRIVESGGTWDEVRAKVAENATNRWSTRRSMPSRCSALLVMT